MAVEEAGKVGKSVAAHAHGIDGIRNAVKAGVRTVEHGTYLHQDERVMDTMAERGTFLVPTLKAGFDVPLRRASRYSSVDQRKIEAEHEDARSVRRALELGAYLSQWAPTPPRPKFHGRMLWNSFDGGCRIDTDAKHLSRRPQRRPRPGFEYWLGP